MVIAAIGTLAAATGSSDPLVAQQGALDVIDMDEAWAITHGADGQRIGIVDTGLFQAHEELQGGVVAGGYDFMSDPALAGDGDGRDGNFEDDGLNGKLAHGSHVAGILAARGDDGVGIAGLNWNANVVMARALSGTQGGTNIDIMAGARWLAGLHVDGVPDIDKKVDVINMSLGFPGACGDTQKDVDDILAQGVLIVAAAGNHGADFGGVTDDTVQAPANCDGVISVGATDFDKAQTGYTNSDGRIDIVAPGGDGSPNGAVLSLGAGASDYELQQGTSMATPHVTGVVSLMLAVDPTLSPQAISAILLALPSTCSGCNQAPMLDAKRALDAVRGDGPTQVTQGGCAQTPGSSSSTPATAALFATALAGGSVIRRRRVGVPRAA
ncbi:MAG TPA: S8 family serine peptidase [Myxococcota bacterium]